MIGAMSAARRRFSSGKGHAPGFDDIRPKVRDCNCLIVVVFLVLTSAGR
jgi:hypothetical protein